MLGLTAKCVIPNIHSHCTLIPACPFTGSLIPNMSFWHHVALYSWCVVVLQPDYGVLWCCSLIVVCCGVAA